MSFQKFYRLQPNTALFIYHRYDVAATSSIHLFSKCYILLQILDQANFLIADEEVASEASDNMLKTCTSPCKLQLWLRQNYLECKLFIRCNSLKRNPNSVVLLVNKGFSVAFQNRNLSCTGTWWVYPSPLKNRESLNSTKIRLLKTSRCKCKRKWGGGKLWYYWNSGLGVEEFTVFLSNGDES